LNHTYPAWHFLSRCSAKGRFTNCSRERRLRGRLVQVADRRRVRGGPPIRLAKVSELFDTTFVEKLRGCLIVNERAAKAVIKTALSRRKESGPASPLFTFNARASNTRRSWAQRYAQMPRSNCKQCSNPELDRDCRGTGTAGRYAAPNPSPDRLRKQIPLLSSWC